MSLSLPTCLVHSSSLSPSGKDNLLAVKSYLVTVQGLTSHRRTICPNGFNLKITDFGASQWVAVVNDGGIYGRGANEEEKMGTCTYMNPKRIDPEHWRGKVMPYLIRPGQRPDWATLL